MAELLEANEIFFTAFEPKVQNRFIVNIDGVPAYLIKAAARPSITNGTITLDHINLKRKLKIVTLWAVPVWILIAGTILSGVISVRDLDWFHRMSTPAMELQATDGN